MLSKSVCLLVGNEEFLKEEWVRGAKQKIFKGEPEPVFGTDFGQFRISTAEDLTAALDTAKTSPFLSKKRLLVLRGIDKLADSEPAQQQLLNYAIAPPPHTILILDADIKEKDFPPNKFFEKLSKLVYIQMFRKIYDRDLFGWIAGRFAAAKKRVEPKAAELLRQLKGNDLRALDNEIGKLCTYAGQRAFVTSADVQQLVGRDITSRFDDIIDAISRNDGKGMIETSFDFQNMDRKEFGGAAGLFCWQFRRMLRAKEMIKENRSQKKIASELKVWNKDIERFMAACKKLKASWLKRAIKETTEFDLKIKTGGQPDLFLDWQALLLRLFTLASL